MQIVILFLVNPKYFIQAVLLSVYYTLVVGRFVMPLQVEELLHYGTLQILDPLRFGRLLLKNHSWDEVQVLTNIGLGAWRYTVFLCTFTELKFARVIPCSGMHQLCASKGKNSSNNVEFSSTQKYLCEGSARVLSTRYLTGLVG